MERAHHHHHHHPSRPPPFRPILLCTLSASIFLAFSAFAFLGSSRFNLSMIVPTWKPTAHHNPPISAFKSLPLQIRGERYAPYLPHFHQLLTRWVRNKRFQPDFMKGLLKTVKFPLDRHYSRVLGVPSASQGKRYASCAVVGNSGILLKQKRGIFIDKHEMVIRLNNAGTIGYERFVGSKTTLAFVNSNIFRDCSRKRSCQCQFYGKKVPVIMYICQVLHFIDVAMCSQHMEAPLFITEARFDKLCTQIVKYYSLRNFVQTTGRPGKQWTTVHDGNLFHYSSGMQAVILALGICDKVSILGFGKAPNASHHYHSKQTKEIDIHDYDAEYLFYHDLANNRSDSIPFLGHAGIAIPPVQIHI